ncbi:MAG TPA: NAD-dependent succinate-semialdehyde dehydrogenase [Puia sp.]|jgi:succinate-semialdehyde dehydrogenase/glutarate-semialdehyde dehydrogenase|nr:NAD-dependent succinate-semialdehyde dehydrogenase [Puia sp.]
MSAPVFKSIYPYTQEILSEYPLMNDATLDQIINNASKAYGSWKKYSFSERAKILKNVAAILRRDLEIFATLITNEMGKVISEARGEIEKCAVTAEYYAENAENFLKDEALQSNYSKSFISYQPIGVVLGIMPWNFPFWQVFRYAAPTLMAGNTILLKHAPNVCGCAQALEKIFLDAGAPKGVFTSLIIDTPAVEKILDSDLVQAATLTGSERAGSSVASIAGRNIKKTVMELGGSDALIILPDADMKNAVAVALNSRMLNAGQSCIAAKRFIILKDALEEFMQAFIVQLKGLNQGDPFDKLVTTGPMARLDLVDKLDNQLKNSVKMGAKLEWGGEINGCNFKPALLMNVKKGMAAFDEETFGPLAAVIVAKDEMEGIQLANDSVYGLSGSIWTKDLEKGIAIAKQMETGAVYLNTLVRSDPHLPFGGIKKSGYGRELGRNGILEFVNVKTIAADA